MEFGRLTTQTTLSELVASILEAKTQLRLDHDQHDTMIENQITAASEYIEQILDRTLLTTTYQLTFDQWPDKIDLRRPPVQAVSSVEYKDTDGTTQTLTEGDEYYVTTNGDEGQVKPDVNWPAEYSYGFDNITVTYDAGYGGASDIPQPIKQAIISLVIDLYESPGLSLIQSQSANRTIERLLGAYKRHPVL